MQEISLQSDLDIEVIFRDKDTGDEFKVPSYDFDLQYYVYTNKVHHIIQKDGVLSGGTIVNGRLHAFLDAPDLGCGILRVKHSISIPDNNYPDGIRTSVRSGVLDVRIIDYPMSEYTSDPVVINDVIAENFLIVNLLTSEDNFVLETEEDSLPLQLL